jgi:hypothetical protein
MKGPQAAGATSPAGVAAGAKGARAAAPAPSSIPKDAKLGCPVKGGRFMYVRACMGNCKVKDKCPEFQAYMKPRLI